MKSRLLTMVVVAALALTGNWARADVKPGTWAELKAYHAVMSATFHPAEDGNLEPIKTRSGELAGTAKTWAASKPPAEFNLPAILEKLKLLEKESAALDKLIAGKKATDADVKAALVKLHDRFHEIVGACADAGKEAKK